MTDIAKLRKEIGIFFNVLTNDKFTDSKQIEIISMLQELEQYYQDKIDTNKKALTAIGNDYVKLEKKNEKLEKDCIYHQKESEHNFNRFKELENNYNNLKNEELRLLQQIEKLESTIYQFKDTTNMYNNML